MQSKKKRPVKNIDDLRFRMCEIFADLQNDEIDESKTRTLSQVAQVILNTVKVEMINNQMSGIAKQVDFLKAENQLPSSETSKGILD